MTDQASVAIKRINPPELGVPPGYSQVVEVRGGRIIFIAGQTALDGKGVVVGKADFAQQAAQVFENLNLALRSVGCTAANLIKLTVLLRNMDDFVSVPGSPESILCHGDAGGRACRNISGSITTLRSGFPDRNRCHRSRLIVASSIAAKKPPEGSRVGTLRQRVCVFPTLEEREPAPVG
jgi:enamine deaminase RidA (YjgF/YER057c/UK114 family)